MLRPRQFRYRRDRRGKRGATREHQSHPERDQRRAVDKEIEKAKVRPPRRKHR
jgi:hypothetical protein